MDSYDEHLINVEPISVRVHKRPGIYFGDLDDGTGYAIIVQDIVDAVLSWKIGANVTVTLRPDRVEVACHARLPDGTNPWTIASRKPFFVAGDGVAWHRAPKFSQSLYSYSPPHTVVCRNAVWELRDGGEEQFALFDEGICRQTKVAAPDLPKSFCFRVALSIGTERLPFAPASLEQVVERIRYLGGPPEAGGWGRVTFRDERTGESQVVFVTDCPPRSPWRQA